MAEQPLNMDTFNGQFDSLIGGRVKKRHEYSGDYDTYLQGAAVTDGSVDSQPDIGENHENAID